MKNWLKILLIFIALFVLILVATIFYVYLSLGAVSKNGEEKQIEIGANQTYLSIASTLKEHHLIKSELIYKLYVKLTKPTNLQACTYSLNETMGVKGIIEILEKGCNVDTNVTTITFKEGVHMRSIAKLIAENTDNTEDDVWNQLKDTEYLDTLIEEYWFLTEEIKNPKIYYPLEGYLFPDTYEFHLDSSVADIFKVMLDQMGKKLEPFKSTLLSLKDETGMSIHDFMTLSSIIESEGTSTGDRKKIASVFYNRMQSDIPLESCATTYYGLKLDFGTRDLYQSEIDEVNDYNTRAKGGFYGLPVGPISNPGLVSIEATIEPDMTNYLFFVSDNKGNTHFTETYAEHEAKIRELESQGLWMRW